MSSNISLKLELNIALVPDDRLAERLVAASQGLARRHPTIVRLGRGNVRLAMAPHLTLYQVPLAIKDVEEATNRLASIIATSRLPFNLQATTYVYNEGEASFEVDYEVTNSLLALQTEVIDALNPMRGELLLERDPGGNSVSQLLQADGVLGKNIRETGYAEVGDPREGGLFRPHATLNWFERGTKIELPNEQLPPIDTLSGAYKALAVYTLGPNGTCPQRLWL